MVKIKAFKGFRPPKDIADKVAARPYDVLSSEEARIEISGNPFSLLHITKPEIDLSPDTDEHAPEVYQKGIDNYKLFKDKGYLVQDEKEKLYIYAQTINGKTQYGLVACASVDDYLKGIIKKHELTRKEKEEDRMKHIRNTNANIEPVFFSYPHVDDIDNIIDNIVKTESPEYDFVAEDGIGHQFWVINDENTIHKLIILFEKKVPFSYVADGHHRTAAAALVGKEKRKKNPDFTGKEEFNYFLAVHFPDNQLSIIDYNRVVQDLNGLTEEKFMKKISINFSIEKIGKEIYKPNKLHEFSMYLNGKWYKLSAKQHTYNNTDPIGILDVTVLSKYVLDDLLDIKDLRTSKRIDFIGGIRGLSELRKRVDCGKMKVAFALFPVTMKQLIDIANANMIMPPKTTWFEPKLRSGLCIHELD